MENEPNFSSYITLVAIGRDVNYEKRMKQVCVFKKEQNKIFAVLQKIYCVFGSVMSFDNLRQRGA